MPTPDDIASQQRLLDQHRANVRTLLEQIPKQGGPAYALPGTLNSLADARAEIARVKVILRGWGVEVADHPDDQARAGHAAPRPGLAPVLQSSPHLRTELLDRLARRYQELLDHALPRQVRLQLGLHTRPDAVDPAWRRMLLRGSHASPRPVPPNTPLLELFDRQQGQLLVLGAPGAGKTTLLNTAT